jgi:hypothetical protein
LGLSRADNYGANSDSATAPIQRDFPCFPCFPWLKQFHGYLNNSENAS